MTTTRATNTKNRQPKLHVSRTAKRINRRLPMGSPHKPLQTMQNAPDVMRPADVLQLQRTVGNRAVAGMIQRKRGVTASRPGPKPKPKPISQPQSQPLVQRAGEENDATIQDFSRAYTQTFKDLPQLQVDISGRLQQFTALANNYGIEDYTSLVFDDNQVSRLLININDQLGRIDDETETTKVSNRIADLVLFTSLIPTQVTEHTRRLRQSRFSRFAVEVMNVNKLREILMQMSKKLAFHDSADGTESYANINFGNNDDLAQRMLKTSLTQLQSGVRGDLQDNDLFRAILASGDIMSVIMASGGAIEQRFLNTCAAVAVTQDIQTRVSSIIGLLQAGRGVATYVETEATNSQHLDKKVKGGLFRKKQTVGQLATKRVAEARATFNSIEQDATRIMANQPIDFAALQALTRPWNRVMQKLAGVINLTTNDGNLPVLSKKYIDEAWGWSAALSTVSLIGLDRPGSRLKDTDADKLAEAGGATADLSGTSTTMSSLRDFLNVNGNARQARRGRLNQFWENVAKLGGSTFNLSSHALYMKAILHGGRRVFAIGDPKIDKYIYKTIRQMERYANKNTALTVPAQTIADEQPLPGYVIGNNDLNVYNKASTMIYNLMAQEKRHPRVNTLTILSTIESDRLEETTITSADQESIGGEDFYNIKGSAPREQGDATTLDGYIPASRFMRL